MEIWAIFTIAFVVIAAVATSVTLIVLYKKKRAARRANEAYNTAVLESAVLADNVKKAETIDAVGNAAGNIAKEAARGQGITFDVFAESNREILDLRETLAKSVVVTNLLAEKKEAINAVNKAETAKDITQEDLKFYNKAANKIKQNTANTLQLITKELEKQNQELKAFKKNLQERAVKQAQQVSSSSITPPTFEKTSVRAVWDAAQFAVVTDTERNIKLLAEVYNVTEKDAEDLRAFAKEQNNPTKCDFMLKIDGGCPDGYEVTDDTIMQCVRGPCKIPKPPQPPVPQPPVPQPPSNVPNECVFKTRDDVGNGVYKCPQGWKDTGLDWGMLWGDAQCMTPNCKNPNPGKTVAKGAQCKPITRTDRLGDGWKCPHGFMDTGLGHEHVNGDKIQCVQDTCKFPDKILKDAQNPEPPKIDRPKKLFGDFVITQYSNQSNTPCNSIQSASGRKMIPFVSVAIPFRFTVKNGGPLNYGDWIFADKIQGRVMPNGRKHTGWLRLDDFCGDGGEDGYCFQNIGGKSYPNVDVFIGNIFDAGLKNGSTPIGSGQELMKIYTGNPGDEAVTEYGGSDNLSGKCGDCQHSVNAYKSTGSKLYYVPEPWTAKYCN